MQPLALLESEPTQIHEYELLQLLLTRPREWLQPLALLEREPTQIHDELFQLLSRPQEWWLQP